MAKRGGFPGMGMPGNMNNLICINQFFQAVSTPARHTCNSKDRSK